MTRTAHTRQAHRVRRGLDLPLAGEPEPRVEPAGPVSRVALLAADFPGLKPRMLCREGDRLPRGAPLFEDRRAPGVIYAAPGAGAVEAIHRGERRALLSVVIRLDDDELAADGAPQQIDLPELSGGDPAALDAAALRSLMTRCGWWTALRARPFGHVPAADATPDALYVTAVDTHPLAPDPALALADREDAFRAGLAALVTLAAGAPLRLCRAPGSRLGDDAPGAVEVHEFSGPHPAGTPGLHMHLVDPVGRERTAWHVGYPDVADLGELLLTGRLPASRVISLGGPAVRRPRLLATRPGASVGELVDGELQGEGVRVIAGSALNGAAATTPELAFLGRYHRQITALAEVRRRRLLGWLTPGLSRFSASRLFLSAMRGKGARFPLDTDTHGGPRAMVPTGVFEKVLPFDVMPTFLLRALLAGDLERAEELGCLELDEEDVALASLVCPSKIDYGAALRGALDQLEKEI